MSGPEDARVLGPLAPLKAGFIEELDRLGYSRMTATQHVHLLHHLSQLVASEGVEGKIAPDVFARLAAARREAGYTHQRTERALAPLANYLRVVGVAAPLPPSGPPRNFAEELLERYRGYLVSERSLAESTVYRCARTARRFLEARGCESVQDIGRLSSADVSAYVLVECRRSKTGQAKLVSSELRSLLRFLHIQGLTEIALVGAVPSVASWRMSGLPKALEPGEVEWLFATCDGADPIGQRNFAILKLLARLGLRRCEVAALELGDIDWRAGEILIRGKGARHEPLPLPSDVGEALAAHLRNARPPGEAHVFLRSRAPAGPISANGVAAIVAAAGRKAGLEGRIGSHRLRHTAATEMLRAGTPLREIGQVLRHRSSATTAIYAKVDREALRSLARSWPGGAR